MSETADAIDVRVVVYHETRGGSHRTETTFKGENVLEGVQMLIPFLSYEDKQALLDQLLPWLSDDRKQVLLQELTNYFM